jgi:hypothetical protein
MQHPTGRLRAGTICSARAHLAGRARKDNLNALWIMQRGPSATLLPLWTRRTLSLPVDLEMGGIEALIGFRLPTVIGQDRTQQPDAMVLLTADQQLGIDIAGIHELFLWQQVRLSEFLLNRRGDLHILQHFRPSSLPAQ